MSLKTEWDKLLELTPEEQVEHDASMLAFQFLGRIDYAMQEQKISKKALAAKVGTSASFITQLFRGDRKPSWNILAKMQKELALEFKVITPQEMDEVVTNEISEYHKKWNKKRAYEMSKGLKENYNTLLYRVEDKDYALAG
jgi:transcriptional regulator with XRE-family HTH domain